MLYIANYVHSIDSCISQIQKREVDSNSHCEVVKYNLVLSEIKSSTSCKPCMPITVTGGENTITYHVTDLHAGSSTSCLYECKDHFCMHIYIV